MDDEQLACAIVAAAGVPAAGVDVEDFLLAGEWAQAGIEAMALGLEAGVRFPRVLIEEALRRWSLDMGALDGMFAAALEHAA